MQGNMTRVLLPVVLWYMLQRVGTESFRGHVPIKNGAAV